MSNEPWPLLLVDDDAAFRKVYGALLRQAGYRVEEATDRDGAREAFGKGTFGVVLLDLMLPPDGSVQRGLRQLAELLAARPGVKVVVVSGAGDVQHTLQAVRAGAYDFLTKPVDPDVLLTVVQRAVTRAQLERRLEQLQDSLSRTHPDDEMVGQSPAFLEVLALTERMAPSDLPVLVTGENGTGKELLARTLHRRSRRAEGSFVAVNCGALTETLLESTLFGHVRGAFTGAVRDRPGLFVEAHRGTLFLDEVADMPPVLQVKLLRVLESGEVRPVGADQERQVDVRIVSATNRDLDELLSRGAFREDLYWRIKGTELRLPPLRERAGDVALLARHFLNRCAHLTADGLPRSLSDSAVAALAAHPWPGNLRELRHEMQRASVLAGERRDIEAADLTFAEPAGQPGRAAGAGSPPQTLHQKVEALERREIDAALASTGGNRTRAATALGLSRQGLLKKMERYGMR